MKMDKLGLEYKFSKNENTSSSYALCFAKFIEYLICKKINVSHEKLHKKIIYNLYKEKKKINKSFTRLSTNKNFMQLLCFSLSLLSLIKKDNSKEIKNIVRQVLPKNIKNFIENNKLCKGEARTGNISMFLAVILFYRNSYLKKDNSLDLWFKFHEKEMNKNGFWGNSSDHYLQFQNGYHQYEIFYFFKKKIKSDHVINMFNLILRTADTNFQFAPYFGGNSCYDYDAVFMLIYLCDIKKSLKKKIFNNLKKLQYVILNDINIDGGFSDSKFIRPRNFQNIFFQIKYLLSSKNFNIFFKRLRFFISLQRNKYNQISTQFQVKKRNWNESNLWDTWFRLLLIAKIDCFVNKKPLKWNFIKFPGLGS